MENCTLIHNILYTITLEESENMIQCNPDCVEKKKPTVASSTAFAFAFQIWMMSSLSRTLMLMPQTSSSGNERKTNKQINLFVWVRLQCIQFIQDLYPLSETNFKDFLRTQIESSRTLTFTLNPSNSQDFKINSLDGLHKFPTM